MQKIQAVSTREVLIGMNGTKLRVLSGISSNICCLSNYFDKLTLRQFLCLRHLVFSEIMVEILKI